ncbi:MAG: NAD-dependent epimerase/dehydratase family protein [Erysipelotrichaceae bacterium]|nr:NAD-dependent epimerase/dehydratase family protein [Erysipelotrichaceae bacterium]
MYFSGIVKEDIAQIIDTCGKDVLLEAFGNRTVLITGASGMVGSYFGYTFTELNRLYDANITVMALVRNPDKLDPSFANDKHVKVVKADVVNPIETDCDVHYIIHAASAASPKIMATQPVETNFANTLGTANTLRLAKEKNALGYLFVSSREIYGEPNPGQELFTEDGPLGQVNPLVPRNGYAEGKKAAENMCSGYREEYGLNTKICRLAHTYGPGMSIYDGRVQADFLNDVVHGRNIVLKSDGSSVRTYTYIADAVCAMLLILTKSSQMVYNVADEDSKTSIRQLAETLVTIDPGQGLQLVFDIPEGTPKGTASFKSGILCTDRIRKELGWKPKYSIKEGFARTIVHIKEETGL